MEKYGTDKPDLRNPLEIIDVTFSLKPIRWWMGNFILGRITISVAKIDHVVMTWTNMVMCIWANHGYDIGIECRLSIHDDKWSYQKNVDIFWPFVFHVSPRWDKRNPQDDKKYLADLKQTCDQKAGLPTTVVLPGLVNIEKTMEKHHFWIGKSTISMAISNGIWITLWQFNIAIEHCHRNSWFTYLKWVFSIVMWVSQMVLHTTTWGFLLQWGFPKPWVSILKREAMLDEGGDPHVEKPPCV